MLARNLLDFCCRKTEKSDERIWTFLSRFFSVFWKFLILFRKFNITRFWEILQVVFFAHRGHLTKRPAFASRCPTLPWGAPLFWTARQSKFAATAIRNLRYFSCRVRLIFRWWTATDRPRVTFKTNRDFKKLKIKISKKWKIENEKKSRCKKAPIWSHIVRPDFLREK